MCATNAHTNSTSICKEVVLKMNKFALNSSFFQLYKNMCECYAYLSYCLIGYTWSTDWKASLINVSYLMVLTAKANLINVSYFMVLTAKANLINVSYFMVLTPKASLINVSYFMVLTAVLIDYLVVSLPGKTCVVCELIFFRLLHH